MKRQTILCTIKSRFLASLGMRNLIASALVVSTMGTGGAPLIKAQVTGQRLLDSAKEPQNWLMYSGDYAGRRFSALDQIKTSNAAMLVPKWVYQTMAGGRIETKPLVVDGILFRKGQDHRAVPLDRRAGRPVLQ